MFSFLEKHKIYLVYIPLALYWGILLAATTVPAQSLPPVGMTDKLNHLLAYFVLAILLNLTLVYQRKSALMFRNASIFTFLIASVYGALDEVHQMFVPGRYAEVLDWVADAVGALAGIIVLGFLLKRFKYNPDW